MRNSVPVGDPVVFVRFVKLLAAVLELSAGGISITEAEAFAKRDEATLHGGLQTRFFNEQGKALGRSLIKCGVTDVRQASGLLVVMKLDGNGRVTKTWLNNPSVVGRCVEKEIQSAVLPTDGRPEFYTFIGLKF